MELMPEIAERPVTINEVKERAQEKIDERINQKKKPLNKLLKQNSCHYFRMT